MNLSARVERSRPINRSSWQMAREAWAAASTPALEPEEAAATNTAEAVESVPATTPATGDYGDDLREHVTQFTRFCVQSLANVILTSSTPTIG